MSDTFYNGTGEYYTLAHLTLFTGLTDRTLRNYIRAGVLEGEKINGVWHSSLEQTEAFLHHPMVRPSIQAKQNSVIYDFLLEDRKKEPRMCMVLDLPGEDREEVSEFFCKRISQDPSLCNLHFVFDAVPSVPRVILTGVPEQLLSLVQGFCARKEQ